MAEVVPTSTERRSRYAAAILWGGLMCGTLDITAALVVYGFFGLTPIRLLQGIAAGLLGPLSFGGGWATALLGLCLHFVIAFTATSVYVMLCRWIVFLLRHALLSGAL